MNILEITKLRDYCKEKIQYYENMMSIGIDIPNHTKKKLEDFKIKLDECDKMMEKYLNEME